MDLRTTYSTMLAAKRTNRNKRSHDLRRRNRLRQRQWATAVITHLQFEQTDATRRQFRTLRRHNDTVTTTEFIHRTSVCGQQLSFIGYGLSAVDVPGMGIGVVADIDLAPHTILTQYEGVAITKEAAATLRAGNDGKHRASHFCSIPTAKHFVIDGFRLIRDEEDRLRAQQLGIPALSECEMKGRGGGSLMNHSDSSNAEYFSPNCHNDGDAYGLYIRVKGNTIPRGTYVTVDYGNRFISSNISNI